MTVLVADCDRSGLEQLSTQEKYCEKTLRSKILGNSLKNVLAYESL